LADTTTSDPVVAIGLGRFGSALALELARRGTEVLAIDNNPKHVHGLAGQITHRDAADATDMATLRQRACSNTSPC
jgi:trk system potassium uptake protein TrkA